MDEVARPVDLDEIGVGATFLPALCVRAEAQGDSQLAAVQFPEPERSRDNGPVWQEQSARRSEYLSLEAHIRDVLDAEVPKGNVLASVR